MKKLFSLIAVAATLGACTQSELKSNLDGVVVTAAVLGAACMISSDC